ncbi:hypothetical protein L202_01562 [Cryptococcus amylolentus CBS 6039]|uniref:Palmitoyltransferase n=2 Tax=Cryptococcus amylolentus TaxID=104669 RepID=A0A1E3I425_9TREE|nr:hypothetical protein L202_01562 [Cryptococcus amylolentus CBS 6039]ODN83420.1 hypothetical protein L202_01562 [Cryptococcus amylolentus CBS 6039]ODO10947.1 hypothetical protein I350_01546 [Cryptococcus amylolentus CBS 6273]
MGALDGLEVKRGTHTPRYCKTCEHYKPPRAHHCRSCKTCWVNHCPWVGNCVGFFNQGHFIRFLLWVDIATTFHLLMMLRRVMAVAHYYIEPSLSDVLFLVFNFAACIPVWLCVGMFSIYHLYLASGNSTTIEGWEKDKVATLIRRGKIKEVKYPYNIGMYKNLKSVLGPQPLLWLWPQKMRGDGLSFPVNPEAGGESASDDWAGIVAPNRDLDGPRVGGGTSSSIAGGSGSGSNVGLGTGEEHHDCQYFWPPQDPSRYPNPPPRPSTASSPFTYGDGFNPNLRPSNALRSRAARDHEHSLDPNGPNHTFEEGEGEEAYSSGEDRDNDSIRTSSSPEPYLSDYDEYNEGPLAPGERMTRVRRGSEGWEVMPVRGGWYAGGGPGAGYEEEHQGRWQEQEQRVWDDQAGEDGESWEGVRGSQRPWEDRGRYNIYYPEE